MSTCHPSDPSQSQARFTCFGDLCCELRLMIWKEAALGSCLPITRAKFKFDEYHGKASVTLTPPAILLVNWEARREALAMFSRSRNKTLVLDVTRSCWDNKSIMLPLLDAALKNAYLRPEHVVIKIPSDHFVRSHRGCMYVMIVQDLVPSLESLSFLVKDGSCSLSCVWEKTSEIIRRWLKIHLKGFLPPLEIRLWVRGEEGWSKFVPDPRNCDLTVPLHLRTMPGKIVETRPACVTAEGILERL